MAGIRGETETVGRKGDREEGGWVEFLRCRREYRELCEKRK